MVEASVTDADSSHDKSEVMDVGKVACNCGEPVMFGFLEETMELLIAHKGCLVTSYKLWGWAEAEYTDAQRAGWISRKVMRGINEVYGFHEGRETCLSTWNGAIKELQKLGTII